MALATKKKTAPPKLIRNAGPHSRSPQVVRRNKTPWARVFSREWRVYLPCRFGVCFPRALVLRRWRVWPKSVVGATVEITPCRHDHPSSGYRIARWSLLSRTTVSVQNIHAIPIKGVSPQQAATNTKQSWNATMVQTRSIPIPIGRSLTWHLFGISKDGHMTSPCTGQCAQRAISPYGEQQDEAGNCGTRPDRRRDDTGWAGSPRRASSLAHRSHCRVRGMCAAMRMGH